MDFKEVLSEPAQEYLKAVYKLQRASGGKQVSLTSLARQMGASLPAAAYQLQHLAAEKLVQRSPYRGVALTPRGERVALTLIRHHRLIERFMVDTLGFGWDRVDEEADRLEHVISEDFAQRVEALLGYPRTCPHGDPIPTKDGVLPELRLIQVVELHRGQGGPFRRVGNTDPQVLRYLAEQGFKQGVLITFLEKAPFQGPVRLKVGDNEISLGAELASQIFVEETGSE